MNFLRALRAVILRRVQQPTADLEQIRVKVADLEHAPFNRIGGVHRLFSAEEIMRIVDFANQQVA